MGRCIFCGKTLTWLFDKPDPMQLCIGFKCETCNLQWTIEDHKNSVDWAIRHIRSLETAVQSLEKKLDAILKEMKTFNETNAH